MHAPEPTPAVSAPAPPRRPVLLAVDDDAGVGRAVQRDLRRRYGERYQVVGADSGAGALEVLRALKLRDQEVALLLSDQRMPGMEGVDFLEQAIELTPVAKRVLLTAYADTQAAIKAINDVSLDHGDQQRVRRELGPVAHGHDPRRPARLQPPA